MADPTFSEIFDQAGKSCKVFDKLDSCANSDTPNLLGLIDTLIQNVEGDNAQAAIGGVNALRGAVSAGLSTTLHVNALRPYLLELARVIGTPERDNASIMRRLRDFMEANDEDIKRRVFTFGAPAAGVGNTGNGVVLRLTVDENGIPSGATHAELRTATCVADASQTDLEEETFEFRGEAAEPDFMDVIGSGQDAVRLINMSSARESENLLSNPSFSSDSAGVPSIITGWEIDNAFANFEIVTTPTYRGFPGDTTPRALKIIADDAIEQILDNNLAPTILPDVPYYLQVAVFKEAGATGNLTLSMGATTRVVTIASLATGQNVVRIVVSPDETLFFKTFNEVNLSIRIEVDTLAVASIVLDDILFIPFKRFDNLWYVVVPNAAVHVAFLVDDIFTFTDVVTVEAIIAKCFWRAGLGDLRSIADGSETIPEP